MNVQPWAMYIPQAYQPYPLAGMLGGIAPGIGGGQLAPQSLIGNLLSGLAGLPGQGSGGQFGYPQIGQFGQPQIGQFGYPQGGQGQGSLGGLLPFYAALGMLPGVWGGPQAGQFPPQGLFGTPFGQGAGLLGQGSGGPFGYPQGGQGLGGQFGYPQGGQGQGSLAGAWGGQLPYLGGQWVPHGLMGNLLSGLAGHAGQPIGGVPPFQTTPGMTAVA